MHFFGFVGWRASPSPKDTRIVALAVYKIEKKKTKIGQWMLMRMSCLRIMIAYSHGASIIRLSPDSTNVWTCGNLILKYRRINHSLPECMWKFKWLAMGGTWKMFKVNSPAANPRRSVMESSIQFFLVSDTFKRINGGQCCFNESEFFIWLVAQFFRTNVCVNQNRTKLNLTLRSCYRFVFFIRFRFQ